MKQTTFNHLLRNAVIAALPIATQVSCATAEPESKPEPEKPTETVTKADPCRTGETTMKSATRRYSTQIRNLTTPLTAEQCLSLCKEQFERTQVGGSTDLVSLKKVDVSNCSSEIRPYSDVFMRRGNNKTPSTKLTCDVEYTAVHSPTLAQGQCRAVCPMDWCVVIVLL